MPENRDSKLRPRPAAVIALLAVVVLECMATESCSSQSASGKPAQSAMMNEAAPVTVARAVLKTVPVEITAIGNVEAFSTVSVKSQVSGIIQRAYFREGQDVKASDLLFSIDPRPFQAALDQAKANLARDQAQAENAEAQAKRFTELFKAGIVSQDQYDQYRTSADALNATVRADRAAIENAQIQLGYCTIRSPITGRTGSLMVHPGNLIKDNDAALVTINQIQPIYIDFAVPQQYLPEIKREMASHPLKVQVSISQDNLHPATGTLSFINNTVDTSTGTILLKGIFANRGKRLWPGQFVNVVLDLAQQPNTVVVPSQAVQAGLKGLYVYVVKPDDTVEVRPVETGATLAGEAAILKGIKAGETVVTDGQLRLFPGAKVTIKNSSSISQGSAGGEAAPQEER